MAVLPSSNASTVSPISYDLTTTEMSWQSIFWALVPIALNSMIQPCGIPTPSMHPGVGFPFRASPVFCICDALLLFSQIVKQSLRTKSAQAALDTVARRRFPSSTSRSVDLPSSLAVLQETYILRATGFALGALPQAVKLYTCSGLWWTKIWVSMFLLSFAILEVFINLLKYRRVTEDREHTSPLDLDEVTLEVDILGFEYCVLPISWLQLGAFMESGIPEPKKNKEMLAERDTMLPLAIIVMSLVVAACMVDFLKTHFRVEANTRPALIVGCANALIMLVAGYCIAWAMFMAEKEINLLERGWLSMLVILGLIMVGTSIAWVVKPSRPNGRLSSVSLGAAYLWAIAHIYITFSYYSTAYDPKGTVKPSWTNYLG